MIYPNWSAIWCILYWAVISAILTSGQTKQGIPQIRNGIAFETIHRVKFITATVNIERLITLPDYTQITKVITAMKVNLEEKICQAVRIRHKHMSTQATGFHIITKGNSHTRATQMCTGKKGRLPDMTRYHDKLEVEKLFKKHPDIKYMATNIEYRDQHFVFTESGKRISTKFKAIYYQRIPQEAGKSIEADKAGTIPHANEYKAYITRRLQIQLLSKFMNFENYVATASACEWLNTHEHNVDTETTLQAAELCELTVTSLDEKVSELETAVSIAIKPLRPAILRIKQRRLDDQIRQMQRTFSNTDHSDPDEQHYESLSSAPKKRVYLKRNKRSLPLATLPLLWGFGKSIFNFLKLRRMSRTIDSMTLRIEDVETLASDTKINLDETKNEITQVGRLVAKTQKFTQLLGQINIIDKNINRELATVHRQIHRLNHMIRNVVENRATVHLIDSAEISDADDVLRKHINEGTISNDYRQMKIRVIDITHEDILVNLEIPVYEAKEETVIRLYAMPDLAQNRIVQLPFELFVINHDSTQYFPINAATLQRCLRQGCERPDIVRQTSDNECGITQYLSKPQETCKWEPYYHQHRLYKTSKGALFAFTNPTPATVTCRHITKGQIRMNQTGFITIPPGCKITIHRNGTNEVIHGPNGAYRVSQIEAINKNWISPIQGLKFTSTLTVAEDMEHVQNKVQQLLNQLKHTAQAVEKRSWRRPIIVLSITIIVIATLIIMICICQAKVIRTSRKMKPLIKTVLQGLGNPNIPDSPLASEQMRLAIAHYQQQINAPIVQANRNNLYGNFQQHLARITTKSRTKTIPPTDSYCPEIVDPPTRPPRAPIT